jgi:hypothetical protein
MTNSIAVTINPLPTAYTVTGGGGYCAGGAGVHIGLSNSTIGINYQLMNGAVPIGISIAGTNAALDFGLLTLGGTYSVQATNATTLCTNGMSGVATVTVNALPTVYNVTGTGTGHYCAGGAGVHLGVSNSTSGVNYQLYNAGGAVGLPVAGVNGVLDLGAQTAAGTYTVVATNATSGCQSMMNGTFTVFIDPLPTIYSVTGGGQYCAGGTGVLVGVGNSEGATITYNLYRGGTLADTHAGTNAAFNFNLQTVAGTYSVVALNSVSLCSSNMSGIATVTITPLPTAYTVSGTGSYCAGGAGVHVLLSGSATGINYQLYKGASTIGTPMAGTNISLDFGPQTAAGTYTVLATDATTSCASVMLSSATITINAVPNTYTVTGGGHYCAGGTGVHIGTNNADAGISYQLWNGGSAVGSPSVAAVSGVGIDFGLQTTAGTYSVIGTNTGTGCTTTMSGSATVVIDPLPFVYTVGGGGTYCAGGTGFNITTNGSNLGINYQLYNNGSPVGGLTAGTGSGLIMGNTLQTAAGTYSVVAINATTGCTSNMAGSATITVNSLPTVFAMTGGGAYCSGDPGVHVGLANSTLGINYQLFNGSTLMSSRPGLAGSAAIDFGLQTAAGTYTVLATNPITTCSVNMSGSEVVTINPLPTVYTVSGTGHYCAGGTGVDVTINNSQTGVNYQLYRGATLLGSPSPVAGLNGSPVDMGLQTVAGTYTAIASYAGTGCSINMAGSATISIDPLPTVFTVTGGGSYCAGGTGVHLGLNSSTSGITYQLYTGSTLVTTVSSLGGSIDFGLQTTVGNYTVVATNPITNCTSVMSGFPLISTNALPNQYNVNGGGAYCSIGSGVDVQLDNADPGISYQLYNGSTAVGLAVSPLVPGTLDFGLQMAAGTYSVMATNNGTGCTNGMLGNAVIVISPAPTIYTVTGGGHYCQNGTGVPVGLNNSDAGVTYELFQNGSSIGFFNGVNGALPFGPQTVAGTYTVVASYTTTLTCVSNMSGSATVSIDPLPIQYTIFGTATGYCAGGTGIDLFLSNSESTVNYQLINGSTFSGFPIPGNNGLLDLGLQTAQGTYILLGTNASTGCTNYMNGAATVIIQPLPTAYAVTGGGGYCAGTSGVHIGLSNSHTGINYDLYRGNTLVRTVAGTTGSAIDFGLQTTVGSYSVIATNALTHCTNNMAGSVSVSINPLPAVDTVTGGGSYCSGGSGVLIGLANSSVGVNYQLYNGSTPVGFPVPGAGHAIDFGLQTAAGTYSVAAMNTTTSCPANMYGNAPVRVNPLPTVYTLTGGGHYCAGGAGVPVTLMGSSTGVTYRLINGSSTMGTLAGTGTPSLSFGNQTVAGTYMVVATDNGTSCSVNMSGTDTVVVDPLPTVFTVTGGGSYCAGRTGLHVTLNGSQTGVNYQLYNGSTPVGFVVPGTGLGTLDLGLQAAAGTYSVMAINATTSCTKPMSGGVGITINPLLTPSVAISTGMGDSVCEGVTTMLTAMTTNGGTSPTYQWELNGFSAGPGTSTFSYLPTNGDIIKVTMTSSEACAVPATVTNTITLAVLPHGTPAVTITALPGTSVCEGSLATYSATPTFGGTAPMYVWYKNGAPVDTGATYTDLPTNGDIIFCIMVSNYTCRSSDTVYSNNLKMKTDTAITPIIAIKADPATNVAPGTSVTLTAVVTNAGSNPSYQWYLNGSLIVGATFPTLTSAQFNDRDSLTCIVTNGNACALSAFNSVVMHVFAVGVTQVTRGSGDIKLLPNPNKGQFTVKGSLSTSVDEEVSLEITNMLGQVVYSSKVMAHKGIIDEHIQLNSALANGMYILNLRSEGDNNVFHIVVEQ